MDRFCSEYMMYYLKEGRVRRADRKLTRYALQMPEGLTISRAEERSWRYLVSVAVFQPAVETIARGQLDGNAKHRCDVTYLCIRSRASIPPYTGVVSSFASRVIRYADAPANRPIWRGGHAELQWFMGRSRHCKWVKTLKSPAGRRAVGREPRDCETSCSKIWSNHFFSNYTQIFKYCIKNNYIHIFEIIFRFNTKL